MTDGKRTAHTVYIYRRELRSTHAEYLGKETYFEEYTKAGLPWTQDKLEEQRYWIPWWLSSIRTRLGWLGLSDECDDDWKYRLTIGFDVLKHIYDDEDLRAKYSTLYTLDPDYIFTEDFKKDLGHLDCFKKLVDP